LWSFERTNSFKKQFKNLDHRLRTKTETVIRELAMSEDPTKLGIYKKFLSVYSYELDKKK